MTGTPISCCDRLNSKADRGSIRRPGAEAYSSLRDARLHPRHAAPATAAPPYQARRETPFDAQRRHTTVA